jgi:hypothetical protein
MYIGIVICVLGFVSLSFVHSLPMLYLSIVLGIVLGSSLGYHMPNQFTDRQDFSRAAQFSLSAFFAWGRDCPAAIVPLVGAMIVWWGWRTAAVLSGATLLIAGLPIAYVINKIAQAEERDQELAAAANVRRACTGSPLFRSAVYIERSVAPQSILVSLHRDGAAPHGHRRRVGAFRDSPGRPWLEHRGGEQFARRVGADWRADAHRYGLAGRHGGQAKTHNRPC